MTQIMPSSNLKFIAYVIGLKDLVSVNRQLAELWVSLVAPEGGCLLGGLVVYRYDQVGIGQQDKLHGFL